MKLWNVEKTPEGGVKVETILNDEEVLFMLEYALVTLMHRGLVPLSVAKYAEEHKEDAQQEFLANVDKDEIGQA